uniref:H+-transporting two-sector ATPase, alpha/beta subunit, central region, related n=1 Tax=Medicago truncatula TaxID=3880 RepID=A2Q2E9_MEDTR|nr:H+-transporting two-sector ATPase, alpha/beta subunit, central region, related [Medicago truncatula]
MFVWRLFRNRLPTKDNLMQRHVLDIDDNVCVGGCGSQETTNHLLFGCHTFCSIWFLVFQWLSISFVAPFTTRDHFYQLGHLAGLPCSSHSFFQLIWLACIWVI